MDYRKYDLVAIPFSPLTSPYVSLGYEIHNIHEQIEKEGTVLVWGSAFKDERFNSLSDKIKITMDMATSNDMEIKLISQNNILTIGFIRENNSNKTLPPGNKKEYQDNHLTVKEFGNIKNTADAVFFTTNLLSNYMDFCNISAIKAKDSMLEVAEKYSNENETQIKVFIYYYTLITSRHYCCNIHIC